VVVVEAGVVAAAAAPPVELLPEAPLPELDVPLLPLLLVLPLLSLLPPLPLLPVPF
jgi:hypothetical protein